jgi:RNA polymerase sigma factor (sigma-70 family)
MDRDPQASGTEALSRASAPASFEACYEAHYRQSLRIAWAFTGSRSAGEELTQEGWRRAFERWAYVKGLDRPDLWVARVIKNLATSRWRRRCVELRHQHLVHRDEADAGRSPQDDVVERIAVLKLVNALPRQQRVAIGAHYLVGLSQSEAAALLGCSESTLRVHLHRARRKLARWMEEEASHA